MPLFGPANSAPRMKPQVRSAVFEWVAGIAIGAAPLLAHGLLHGFVDPVKGWEDSWTNDLLLFAITNSGLSAVSVFTRLSKGLLRNANLDASAIVMTALTLLLFLFAGMLYGISASGMARGASIWLSVLIALGSTVVSLYFEMTMASRMAAASERVAAPA